MSKFKLTSRKAAIEIQFNWIFVLIAGSIIFIFIVSLILNQKKDADIQISQDVLKKIATNIRGKQQLTDTISQLETPSTSFTFSCDVRDLTADFKISGSQREQLSSEIIFAPKEFTTQRINVWTLDFSIPFIVTRFVYLSPQNMIFLIYNSTGYENYAAEIYNALPQNITKRYVSSVSEINSLIKSYNYYRIICFNNCPNTYKYISILPSSNSESVFGYGIIGYDVIPTNNDQPNNNNRLQYYLGKASLFGAIFSDDKKYYTCQMERAFKQFELKRNLHYQRILLLESELASVNPNCVPVLALPKSTLLNMKDKSLSDVQTIYQSALSLKNDNTDLIFKGCPLIY
ncbi:MAG: hypothetical protein KatS3mg002_0468 [Candidatus Woesearchaeota archaeon]|nr:MAG: hypothetical protein KatS3mg002_0468 [Candidatus Woesearchaeota archaeon]